VVIAVAGSILFLTAVYRFCLVAHAGYLDSPLNTDGRDFSANQRWLIAAVFAASATAFVLAEPLSKEWIARLNLSVDRRFAIAACCSPLALPAIILYGVYHLRWRRAIWFSLELNFLAALVGGILWGLTMARIDFDR
jgi:hypothetical protein